jgi:hypothetical protein
MPTTKDASESGFSSRRGILASLAAAFAAIPFLRKPAAAATSSSTAGEDGSVLLPASLENADGGATLLPASFFGSRRPKLVYEKARQFLQLRLDSPGPFGASQTSETSESTETCETTESSEDTESTEGNTEESESSESTEGSESTETSEDSENSEDSEDSETRQLLQNILTADMIPDEWGPVIQLMGNVFPPRPGVLGPVEPFQVGPSQHIQPFLAPPGAKK